LQNDGKIVLAGTCRNGDSFYFCAIRYNNDGSADTTFATNGKLLLTIGSGGGRLTTIAVQRDEKLVLIGDCNTSSNGDFCAARYHPNGILDTSFGVNGIVITQVGTGFDYVKASTVQPDGKILVAGGCGRGSTFAICLVRYNMDGSIDSSFAGTGKLIEPTGTSFALSIELQQDGKILLAGECLNATNTQKIFCIARYNADASIDTSFGASGKVLTQTENLSNSALAVKIQSDRKIIIAGACYNSSVSKFCAARYNANGSLDTSFAGTGTIATAVGNGNSAGQALALQPDGKILLSGTCSDSNANGVSNNFCAVRYDGGPNTPKTLTEYVYNSLSYYFQTSRDTDKALLDATPGWARTGQSFSSLSFADPGSIGINRYYFDQVAKNQTRGSHFYTLADSEKIALGALNPTNQPSPRLPYNEGIDSYAFLPIVEGVGGRCATGQTPVYRTFRGQSRFPDDPNHRFTTSITLYNQLVAQGWDGEGVKMCAPN
jgi:uncharacterized delta-60 repeat protein